MEPGLLGLPAFCSSDCAVFVQTQTQEHGPRRVPLLGSQHTHQGVLGKAERKKDPVHFTAPPLRGQEEVFLGLVSTTLLPSDNMCRAALALTSTDSVAAEPHDRRLSHHVSGPKPNQTRSSGTGSYSLVK